MSQLSLNTHVNIKCPKVKTKISINIAKDDGRKKAVVLYHKSLKFKLTVYISCFLYTWMFATVNTPQRITAPSET